MQKMRFECSSECLYKIKHNTEKINKKSDWKDIVFTFNCLFPSFKQKLLQNHWIQKVSTKLICRFFEFLTVPMECSINKELWTTIFSIFSFVLLFSCSCPPLLQKKNFDKVSQTFSCRFFLFAKQHVFCIFFQRAIRLNFWKVLQSLLIWVNCNFIVCFCCIIGHRKTGVCVPFSSQKLFSVIVSFFYPKINIYVKQIV